MRRSDMRGILVAMPHRRLGWSWLALCLALAVHVTDEALTDFLSVYNPVALRIGMPVFTFRVWLTGLITAVVVLLILSPFAFRNARWWRPLAYFLAVLMIGNALLHTASSLYYGRLMPGTISSPLLFVAALFLFTSLRRMAVADLVHG
jgi:hypothetical protein